MRPVQRLAVVIGVGCVGLLAAQSRALARGGSPATPSLSDRLIAAVKALNDTAPTPALATSVKSSKSNISYRLQGHVEQPILLATSVRSGRSNQDARIPSGGLEATATYVKATAPSQPLLQVANGKAEEAPVGTLTTDRALVLPAATRVTLAAGTYVIVLAGVANDRRQAMPAILCERSRSRAT